MVICVWGFSGGSAVKNSPAGDTGSIAGKVPWSRAWQPTLVFLLGDSHGQRSLAGYSRWGHRKSRHNLATRKQQSVLYCSYLRCQSASGSDCPWGPSSWSHPLGHLPKVRHPGPGLHWSSVLPGRAFQGDTLPGVRLEVLPTGACNLADRKYERYHQLNPSLAVTPVAVCNHVCCQSQKRRQWQPAAPSSYHMLLHWVSLCGWGKP